MIQWCSDTIIQWYNDAMIQWYNDTMIQLYNDATRIQAKFLKMKITGKSSCGTY